MENKKEILITIVISIILIFMLVLYRSNVVKINEIDFNKINEILSNEKTSILYFGEINDKTKSNMKTYKNKYKLKLYATITDLNNLNEYLSNYDMSADKMPLYIVYDGDTPLGIIDGNVNLEKTYEYIEKFLFNKIPESERYYKTISADKYIDMINGNKYTVAVFGYEGCSYCKLYLPVVNEVASMGVSIYYFDRDNYDINDWDDIMDLDLEIPGECTLDGKPTTFLQSFPKPMTIITKKGKVEGCIRGYVTNDVLIDKLKEFKIIKEK